MGARFKDLASSAFRLGTNSSIIKVMDNPNRRSPISGVGAKKGATRRARGAVKQTLLHPALSADIVAILSMHAPFEATWEAKQVITLALEEELVKRDLQQTIQNIGLSAFASDNDMSEIELSIKDHRHIQGIPPEMSLEDIPETYTPKSYFSAEPPLHPFSLRPPNPIYTPLLGLLRTYSTLYPELPTIISIVHLWTRSHGLVEFSPITLALMSIAFLQTLSLLPNLQEGISIDTFPASNIWGTRSLRLGDHSVQVPASYDTRFFSGEGWRVPPGDLGHFFSGWLHFYMTFQPLKLILSIKDGGFRTRQGDRAIDVTGNNHTDAGDVTHTQAPSSYEPESWKKLEFVVQDPFDPSYAHSADITRVQWRDFRARAEEARARLTRTSPLYTVFGTLEPTNEDPHPDINTDILAYTKGTRPSLSIIQSRAHLIKRVQNAIQQNFGKSYTVECFGSTRYGIDNATSDLDLVIVDRKRMTGFSPDVDLLNLPAAYNVRGVARILQNQQFQKVIAIPSATVPIVKCIDPQTGLAIDINTNEQLGLCNTHLLEAYCNLSPVVRPLLLFIKVWAKSHDLNNPSGSVGPRSFSSYCLTLMGVGYLQKCGALPNLQADLDPPNDQDGLWTRDRTWCDTRFRKPAEGWTGSTLTVQEAILGWFKYWAEDHDYSGTAMSIRDGGVVRRNSPAQEKLPKARRKKRSRGKPNASTPRENTPSENPDDSVDEVVYRVENVTLEGSDPKPKNDPKESLLEQEEDLGFDENVEKLKTELEQDIEDTKMAALGIEPQKWMNDSLIVPDPFILIKNNARLEHSVVKRFQDECARALWILRAGRPILETLGRDDIRRSFLNARNIGMQPVAQNIQAKRSRR